MQIHSIKTYNILAFRGEKDESQPISEAMKTIFRENIEPKSRQRLLWHLSEVPDFYEATKDNSKQDLLELADLFESQKTNILKMAIDGDIKTIEKGEDNLPKIRKLLSLADFIRNNRNLPPEKRQRLIEFLRNHFINQVEEDAIDEFFDKKEYPPGLHYIKGKPDNGKMQYARISTETASLKAALNLVGKGSLIAEDDLDVVFEEEIEKRTGNKIKGFQYIAINPRDVEDEYAVSYPEIYRVVEESFRVPAEVSNCVSEFRKIPYFKNLTRKSTPKDLVVLARVNILSDNLLLKMLKRSVTLEVREPINGKYVQIPIIDTGELLQKMKNNESENKNIVDILFEDSPALPICGLYMEIKDALKGKEIRNIIIERFGNNLGCRVTTVSGEKYANCFNGKTDWASEILKKLDTLPFRKAILNFNTNN